MAEAASRRVLRVEIAPPGAVQSSRPRYARREEDHSEAKAPKAWFPSVGSFAQVLSERNRKLLALIADSEPQSLAELAEISGRAKPNLSRTLRTMARHGLVELHLGAGREVRPRVRYRDIRLDLPVVASHDGVGRGAA